MASVDAALDRVARVVLELPAKEGEGSPGVPPPAWLTQALAVDYDSFLPLRAAERRFGWVRPEFAAVLARFPDVFVCEPQRVSLADALATPAARTEALARVAARLRDEGLVTGWRDEPYEIYAEASGEPLARIERAAVKRFGIRGRAVHLNGIVETEHGPAMWVARRSAAKATDPGKLDNLVGGGVAAGLDAWQTLLKECREEAGCRSSSPGTRGRATRSRSTTWSRTASMPTRSRRSTSCSRPASRPGTRTARWPASSSSLSTPFASGSRCRTFSPSTPRSSPGPACSAGRGSLLGRPATIVKDCQPPGAGKSARAPVPSCTARGTCRWHILCGLLEPRIHVPILQLSSPPSASPRRRSGRTAPRRRA